MSTIQKIRVSSKSFLFQGCRNGCRRSSYADGLCLYSRLRQTRIKSRSVPLRVSGIAGISSERPMRIIAVIGLSKSYWLQGILAVAISRMLQPKLQISAFYVYFVYFMTSGAIQGTEPLSVRLKFSLSDSRDSELRVTSKDLAQPKSASLTWLFVDTRMFAPLMSRCITLSEWRYTRPSRICYA